MERLVIFGGRDFTDTDYFLDHVIPYLEGYDLEPNTLEIVSGGARGADTLAEGFALANGVKFTLFEADWERFGRSAGYRRNAEMAKYCKNGYGLAFWDGQSKGTESMIKLCEQYKIHLTVIPYGEGYS